jgi:hypothetical protein
MSRNTQSKSLLRNGAGGANSGEADRRKWQLLSRLLAAIAGCSGLQERKKIENPFQWQAQDAMACFSRYRSREVNTHAKQHRSRQSPIR